MHVILNGLSALKTKTGIGHYTASLTDELRVRNASDSYVTFPDGWQEKLVRRAYRLVAGSRKPPMPGRRRSLIGSAIRHAAPLLRDVGNQVLQRAFRAACSHQRLDLYHEPNFIPFPVDLPTLATIHDLSVLAHPEWHPVDRVRTWEKAFLAGVKRCQHFIAVSESARREMMEFLGVASHRISVVHNGVRDHLRPQSPSAIAQVRERYALPSEFLLHVGTIEPRKNLDMLIRSFVALPSQLRERCPLLLVGGWGWNTDELAEYYHSTARSAGVRLIGYVDDADLAAVYSAARALVYPSLYEGFGLPPLEMMACGGAVAAADIPPIREVTGQQALLVDPLDADGWREVLKLLITDDDRVAALRTGAVAHARPFTWTRCAAETNAVYHRMIDGHIRQAA